MKIILGLTGSVASILHQKLAEQLQTIGEVNVIRTHSAKSFVDHAELCKLLADKGGRMYEDHDEWGWLENLKAGGRMDKWKKGNDVLHITLCDQTSVLVIAPCSANTLAKLANGICDNLLTCVARAWDLNRPIIIVPAMNTNMWNHPVTKEHIKKLQSWGYIIVPPQSKMLACRTEGMGAMADIDEIVNVTKESLRWTFPCHEPFFQKKSTCKGIPDIGHPGAFATKRKHSIHTGVDLYVPKKSAVHTVEPGRIVCIEQFTGANERTPWWLDTDCILVEGASGVVCYGEIEPTYGLKVGDKVKRDQYIGCVLPVLPDSKFRPDIEGHSVSMLHMELYPHGRYTPSDGFEKDKNDLRDPTPFLVNAINAPTKRFKP